VDLDISLQGPDSTSIEEMAAVTLSTTAGQLYRQGIVQKGYVRWNEVGLMQYEIQIVVPGFEREVQQIDARDPGEVKVIVHLRPRQSGETPYPPVSSAPEVNYVFGAYAARTGDWGQARSYWAKAIQILPDYVPVIVSMAEALLHENQTPEALEYLDRATKLDHSYWRTEALLAEVSLRSGLTGEAIRHAQRAIELGHEEAASVSPLLARALVRQATEVLQAYVKDHLADDAAKMQLDNLIVASGNKAPEQLKAASVEKNGTIASARASPTRGSRWYPAEVDENASPVDPAACNLKAVLQNAGQRIQEFVANVERFTATESLLHETINKSGEVSKRETRKYDYLVSISEIRPGILGVEEYLNSDFVPDNYPGGIISRGLPTLILIFHPYYSGDFSMKCEGLATLNGKRTWQIYFSQRADSPSRIRSYKMGLRSEPQPVALKGRAWFLADSYQIAELQTDLIDTLPKIQLTVDHTRIDYGPVHFANRGLDMWLPQTSEVYSDLKGRRFHRRMDFSNYLLFSVDDKQQISSPKTSP
jgi:tetratricopeptide (TPR) repeat protein